MIVPRTTQRALSNAVVEFSITQAISPESSKYWVFYGKISVFWAFWGYGLGYGKSDHTIG
jgi:hypothetical protein